MIEIQEKCYETENDYNKDIYNEYEQDIKKYIDKYQSEDYNKIIEQDKRTNIMMVFSEMRANIIKWYPFEKDKNVLEIGANYGEITQELVKKCAHVTAIEFSKEKAKCIQKRLKKAQNLNIIISSNLKNINLEEKYDYITLIGTAEYASKVGFNDLKDMLQWAYKNLSEEGKVLLAIDNKFGAKYLAGSTRNKEERPFANYKSYANKDYKLYGKNELEEILNNSGKLNYKFYYPVPNYNLTHLIYTDEFLPEKGKYNIYYREDEEILFNELTLINESIKNNKFDFFTNSYLVEIVPNNTKLSNISFINYSNMRKKNYKIITKLSKEKVVKEGYKEEGNAHIRKIGENIEKLKQLDVTICEELIEDKIISKYIEKTSMDTFLKNILEQGQIETFIKELDKWNYFIKSKFEVISTEKTVFDKYNIQISEEKKNKLTFLKEGFIDAIFQNVFYDGQEYILFDQEWYEESVPLEYIMYRSIRQLFFQYSELEKNINKQKIYERYNIDQYIEEFEALESEWQKELVDEEILKFYSEKWSRIISIEDMKFNFNQQLGKVYLEKDKLQNEVTKLQNELNQMKKGSRFYRWKKFFENKK